MAQVPDASCHSIISFLGVQGKARYIAFGKGAIIVLGIRDGMGKGRGPINMVIFLLYLPIAAFSRRMFRGRIGIFPSSRSVDMGNLGCLANIK